MQPYTLAASSFQLNESSARDGGGTGGWIRSDSLGGESEASRRRVGGEVGGEVGILAAPQGKILVIAVFYSLYGHFDPTL